MSVADTNFIVQTRGSVALLISQCQLMWQKIESHLENRIVSNLDPIKEIETMPPFRIAIFVNDIMTARLYATAFVEMSKAIHPEHQLSYARITRSNIEAIWFDSNIRIVMLRYTPVHNERSMCGSYVIWPPMSTTSMLARCITLTSKCATECIHIHSVDKWIFFYCLTNLSGPLPTRTPRELR